MRDSVVFDVEILRTVQSVPHGWEDTHLLGIAIACLWEEHTQRLRVYGEDNIPALQHRLLAADRISGFNTWNFDFPVTWGISRSEWLWETTDTAALKEQLAPKSNDILRRIWRARGVNPDVYEKHTHGGWSLNNVAWATLGQGKIGHGEIAPKEYQKGNVAWVVNYCADDVMLTRELALFVERYGYVIDPHTKEKLIVN